MSQQAAGYYTQLGITTGGKRGDEWILKFLTQAHKYLAHNGVILLLLSSLTPRKKVLLLLHTLKLTSLVIAEKKLFFEKLEVWEIRKNDL